MVLMIHCFIVSSLKFKIEVLREFFLVMLWLIPSENYCVTRRVIFCSVLSRKLIEVGMSQGVFHWNSFSWVKSDHLAHKVKTLWIKRLENCCRVCCLETRISWFEVWAFLESRPGLFGRCAMELEDLENLIDFRIAHKQCSFLNHFMENTTETPNVNSQAVCLLSEKNLRGSIPKSLNFMGEGFNRNSKCTS